jgi:hypothetical protein
VVLPSCFAPSSRYEYCNTSAFTLLLVLHQVPDMNIAIEMLLPRSDIKLLFSEGRDGNHYRRLK